MNYYANDEQRVRLVAGLRDLADFLDQNPDVPTPWGKYSEVAWWEQFGDGVCGVGTRGAWCVICGS
jgi:hypothetical protein